MPTFAAMEKQREIWVDWLRVIACFMVMTVHSTEPFYIGDGGALVLTRGDAFWTAFIDSLVRCCVPLFAVASSYLLFPLRYSAREFARRRAVRILVPLAIWSVLYAVVWLPPTQGLKGLLFNFNYASGHLWFVYMLVGIYLLMPLLSPWAEKVGRKELLVYLGIWLFTTTFPMLRDWLSGRTPFIQGFSGVPRQALEPLWGEASWNSYGTFYYLSGFIGYLLLGLYFRKFVGQMSTGKTLLVGLGTFLPGFAITAVGFYRRLMATCGGAFPYRGTLGDIAWWETTWIFDSTGIALMTIGAIVLLRSINSDGAFYRSIILPVSQASYGMYLAHMFVLAAFSSLFRDWLGTGGDALWVTPVEILLTAVCSYLVTALVAILLRRIPRLGPWLMG